MHFWRSFRNDRYELASVCSSKFLSVILHLTSNLHHVQSTRSKDSPRWCELTCWPQILEEKHQLRWPVQWCVWHYHIILECKRQMLYHFHSSKQPHVVDSFDQEQRQALLQCFTSCSRPPLPWVSWVSYRLSFFRKWASWSISVVSES